MAKNKNVITAKSENQRDYIRSIVSNPVTIGIGDAGCGKSFIPLGIAIEYILYRPESALTKIVVTRPLVSVGKDIGSLPGSIDERIAPYFRPAYFNLLKILKGDERKLKELLANKDVMFEPLELMRGMTYDNSFIIVDEAQDTLPEQMLMVMTRLGQNSKIIINGDLNQSDILGENGLERCVDRLSDVEYAEIIKFGPADQQRNTLINNITKDFGPCKAR